MKIHHKVVEHDGGWAYKLGDVFSEAFRDRTTALAAAKRVAAEQHVPGSAAYIEYRDEAGRPRHAMAQYADREAAVSLGFNHARRPGRGPTPPPRRGRLSAPSAASAADRAWLRSRPGVP